MIQSIDRAIRVLTALQGSRRMSLTELAARLELAPSTMHGIVRSLVEHGMVCRSVARAATSSALPCSGSATCISTLSSSGPRPCPWAEDLARRTGLAVRTGVLLIDDVVIIHHEPRPDGSRQMPEVGIVIPAHASALGKAMLAFLARGRVAGSRYGELRSMTGETITSAGRSFGAAGRGAVRAESPSSRTRPCLVRARSRAPSSTRSVRQSGQSALSSLLAPISRATKPATSFATPPEPSRGSLARRRGCRDRPPVDPSRQGATGSSSAEC